MADELKQKKTTLEGIYAKLLAVQVEFVGDTQPSRTPPICCAHFENTYACIDCIEYIHAYMHTCMCKYPRIQNQNLHVESRGMATSPLCKE